LDFVEILDFGKIKVGWFLNQFLVVEN
jgi:hypothetical protein